MTKHDLAPYIHRINDTLEKILPDEMRYPAEIYQAMRYSVFAGGKRVRPILVIAAAESASYAGEDLLPAACAVELVHTYSLIHDDLPAMDDDDLRRGKPTCHKAFGEAVAILAGDALLTLAFQVIAQHCTDDSVARKLICTLADAAGAAGMIGGQVVDMLSEQRLADGNVSPEEEVSYIHSHKTGKLIVSAVQMGCILAGCNAERFRAYTEYAANLGLAFQVSDDILDVEGDQRTVGKSVGKDSARGKRTYPAVYGLEQSKQRLSELTKRAVDALEQFGSETETLIELAHMLEERIQ